MPHRTLGRFCRRVLGILCLLAWRIIPAQATEVSFQTGVSALDSSVTEVNFIGFQAEIEDVGMKYHFRGNIQLDHPLTDSLSLTVLALQDPMLQRRIGGRLNLTYEWVTVQAGPFIGIVNTPSALVSPGISASLGLRVPGIAFGSFRGDTAILSSIDGYIQNEIEIKAGMYLPFFPALVPSASMDVIYTERRDTGYTIGRKQTRYSIFVDAAGPYDEYNIHLAFGYQELGWNVYASNQEVFYQLNSIYAGISIAYQLLPGLKITFGGLIPIINWITYKNVKGYIPKNPLFYDFTVGFIWSGNFWGRGQ